MFIGQSTFRSVILVIANILSATNCTANQCIKQQQFCLNRHAHGCQMYEMSRNKNTMNEQKNDMGRKLNVSFYLMGVVLPNDITGEYD